MGSLPITAPTDTYIKGNEGYSSKTYLDSLGKRTTGYGFNLEEPMIRRFVHADVLAGKRDLTKQEADDIYMNKVMPIVTTDARNFAGKEVFDALSPARKMVLLDLSYNLGGPNLGTFKKMQASIKKGDYTTAAQELLRSKYAKQVPERALRNAKILASGFTE